MIHEDIEATLNDFEKRYGEAYSDFRDAWIRTVTKKETFGARRLIPFIGSGLNTFAVGGVMSWSKLVETISVIMGQTPWSSHEFQKSGLGLTEKLQLMLSMCKEPEKRGQIIDAFENNFSKSGEPSDLHRRIISNFSHVATTNYNQILSAADVNRLVLDLTDLNDMARNPYLEEQAIIHLHGYWRLAESKEQKEDRIFRWVNPRDDSLGPMLVLTETQYHKLYARSLDFQLALHELFSRENLCLFFPRLNHQCG